MAENALSYSSLPIGGTKCPCLVTFGPGPPPIPSQSSGIFLLLSSADLASSGPHTRWRPMNTRQAWQTRTQLWN